MAGFFVPGLVVTAVLAMVFAGFHGRWRPTALAVVATLLLAPFLFHQDGDWLVRPAWLHVLALLFAGDERLLGLMVTVLQLPVALVHYAACVRLGEMLYADGRGWPSELERPFIPDRALGLARQLNARVVFLRHPNPLDRVGLQLLLLALAGLLTWSVWPLLGPFVLVVSGPILAIVALSLGTELWHALANRGAREREAGIREPPDA